jgi:hypothetical protein
MFGYAGFAQPAFAALGKPFYLLSVSESIVAADLNTVLTAFVVVKTESITIANAQTASVSFVSSASEALTATDIITTLRTAYGVVIEEQNIADAPIGFAWVKIDNTEGTTWTLIDNRQ